MTTDTTTTRSSDTGRGRNRRRITGIVISALVGAFLAFDVVGKLTRPQSVIDGTEKLGFDSDQACHLPP